MRALVVVGLCAALVAWLVKLEPRGAFVCAAAALAALAGVALIRLGGAPWLLRNPRALRLRRARTLLSVSVATLAVPVLLLFVALALALGGGLQGAVAATLAGLALLSVAAVPRHAYLVQQASRDASTSHGRRFWLAVLVEALMALGLVVLVVWGLSRVAFPLFQVPSGSMWPTLHGGPSGGDVILVDRTTTWGRAGDEFERFDLLVFEHPGYPDKMVKRAVAFGNETVQVRGGSVWIDDEVAPRPVEVALAQMQRAPILHAEPRREFRGRAASQALRAFDERFALWHGGEVQTSSLPEEVAQQTWLLEEPPEPGASSLASPAWRMDAAHADAPRYLLEPHERSFWQRSQPAHPRRGYDLGYLAEHGPLRSRLVVRKPLEDPALAHVRTAMPSAHLGVELELERLADWPQHSGSVRLGFRVEADEEGALEQHVELAVQAGDEAASLGGRVTRFHLGERERSVEVEALDLGAWPAGGDAARLRVHTVDGRFDAWFNGQRVPAKPGSLPGLGLPAAARNVVVWVESDVPVRVTSLKLAAATSYLATGPLREPLEVPAGKLVFLGDNTHFSSDSREWEMIHYRWPDGRRERVAVHEDTGGRSKARVLVPREEMPEVLLSEADEQAWPEEIPQALSLLTQRFGDEGVVQRDEIVVYWNETEMRPGEKRVLLGLSPAPAWQDAVERLAAKAGTTPRRLGLQPAPFVGDEDLVGRVLAVLSPAQRLRRAR